MSLQGVWSECLEFHFKKSIVVENSAGRLSSDAGLLVLREFDQRVGMTERFAQRLDDNRDADRTNHSFLEMTRQRIYGIIAGYEDQNDHDTLRHDPVFQLVCDRLPANGAETASQPTLSRFENSINVPSLFQLRETLVDEFIEAFDEPPARLVFDLDAFDDPTHGEQQLTLFHGFYGQHQYFPLIFTEESTQLVVMVALRHGTAKASLGADDDIEYLVGRLRAVWPDVDLEFRADSGFGVPEMYGVCERLGVWYTFGIGMNPVLKREIEELMNEAVERFDDTGEKQRLFTHVVYRARSWDRCRDVVMKAECHAAGTNRRAVVTNRRGARIVPQGVYDEYVRRGESENRNKELKCDLSGDRLSDHRFMANLFRLHLHATALNLLIRLRNELPDLTEATHNAPIPNDERSDPPTEAALRRAQPATWRLRLIKVAAKITVSNRRVLVSLSSAWPSLPTWRLVLQTVQRC